MRLDAYVLNGSGGQGVRSHDADLHCYRVFRIPTERCHTYLLRAFAKSVIPERMCIERLMNSSSSACALAS